METAWFINGYTKPPSKGDDYIDSVFVSGKMAPFIDMFADVGYKLWTGKANEEVHSVTYGNTGRIEMNTWTYYDPITVFYTPKGDFPFIFAGWYRTESNGQGKYWVLTTSSNWELSDQDIAYSFGGVLQPIFYKKSGATTIYFRSLDGVISKGSTFTAALNGGTMYNIQVPTKEHYIFKGYYSQENGQGTKYYDENGKPVRKWNQSIESIYLYAYWEPAKYYLDLNGRLDNKDSADITGYGTCDIYIDGVKVSSNAIDHWEKYPYGAKYEIKNIQAKSGKRYVGVSEGTLSGTITSTTRVGLEFRTETWADYASASYASGSGTEASPYIIKTPEQLAKLAVEGKTKEITGHYKLGANIDLSAHEWTPIGIGQTYRLQGVFDGNFYCISNMKIESVYTDHTGLFATVYNTGVVKNLIMKSGNIKQGSNVGGISGLADNGGTIKNCIVENMTLQSSTGNNFIGGITGWSWNSNITNNIVRNCNISGIYSGGLFGIGQGAGASRIIDNGVYSNTISGTNAGALYGEIETSAYTVSGCYGQGTVNGTLRKQMYGDSSAWGNWSYSPSINGGYPIQKALFHLGGMTGSQNVYNYLIGTLKFSVG